MTMEQMQVKKASHCICPACY